MCDFCSFAGAQFADAVEVPLLRHLRSKIHVPWAVDTLHHVACSQPVQYPCTVSAGGGYVIPFLELCACTYTCPPWGSNPACLTLCFSLSSAVCFSWHLDRRVIFLAFLSSSGSTAASLGGSPSSRLSSLKLLLWSLWDWHQQLPRQPAEVSGAGDARALGSLPLRTLGSLGPLPSCALVPPTLLREFLFSVAVRPLSLWVASPGVLTQPPASLGRFLGRRPILRSTIARWQEATDPESPEGGSQQACTHGGSGCQPGVRVVPFLEWSVLGSPPFSSRTVALTQSYPADLEETLLQRGCNWRLDHMPAGVRDNSASAELPRQEPFDERSAPMS